MRYEEDTRELVHETVVTFTPREGLIFSVLWNRMDRVVTSEVLRGILDEGRSDALHPMNLYMTINSLKKKTNGLLMIETVKGVGYRLRIV